MMIDELKKISEGDKVEVDAENLALVLVGGMLGVAVAVVGVERARRALAQHLENEAFWGSLPQAIPMLQSVADHVADEASRKGSTGKN